MFKWIRESLNKDEGFTLVELMVVVLIIAILIAIAIPTFLGARQRAQDRAAQSNLRNALTAEKVVYTDDEIFSATLADLTAVEPSLTWQTTVSADPVEVYVRIAATTTAPITTANEACLESQSAAGTTFVMGEIAVGANAGTYYGEATLAACTEVAVAALAASW
jgi:type IV pilus assembly protein PilA